MKYCLVFIFLFFSICTIGQVSPDCSTAIPICNNTPVNSGTNNYGIDDFAGASKSGCLERTLSGAIESNSAWYRFKTNASGQLGFNISVNSSEDWDFALYKSSECSSLSEPIRCNFLDNNDKSSFLGLGEDPTGASNINYEDWLMVEAGEDYYLLINNFSNVNSGFSIQFSGNIFVTNPYDALDCSIISNLLGPPIAACESDFIVLDATISDALTYAWYKNIGSGFQQIMGENQATLTILDSAEYRVVVTRATENTVSDVQVSFAPNPTASSVADKLFCYSDTEFELSIVDAEVLGVQSPNEFIVSYYTTFSDAVNGINSLAKNHPITSGTETIYIRVASFANPKCIDVSQDFDIIVSPEIISDFRTTVFLCEANGIVGIGDDTPNSNFSYLWDTGETTATIQVNQAGNYGLTISTTAAGLQCSDKFDIRVFVSRMPVIANIRIEDLQANNSITIEMAYDGNYEYQLDDSLYQNNPFFDRVLPGIHRVSVNDIDGCGIATEAVLIMGFSKFFTPNGDGINDAWLIEGLSELNSPEVFVFDRYGKLMQQLNPIENAWDGSYNGLQMPASDYWFQLSYIEDNGERIIAKYINNHFSLKR